MMALPCGAMVTTVDEPPTAGTVNGPPLSLVKLTVKETLVLFVFVKYKAEYHPPPKANWGRTARRN
jgi:hypothetical protein